MPDVTDPEIIRFANEGLRPAMDRLAAAYLQAKALLSSYDASGLVSKIPPTADYLADGSDVDGRPRITAGGVLLSMENLRSLLAHIEQTPEGQPMSLIAGVLSISPKYSWAQ
jgi:hypothetical protein